jgi:SAM-dependent methyltransferase
MYEKRFEGDISRLRAPERIGRLEVARVVSLCLEGAEFDTVLDVGTGTGLFAEAFAQRGLAVAGVDVNPDMLVEARKYVPTGDFREATAEALPYPDSAFDLVFMGVLLHESDEQLKVLLESWRVARSRVCILEWAYREEEFGPLLAHRLNPLDLKRMFKKTGFTRAETIPLTKLVFYRLSV